MPNEDKKHLGKLISKWTGYTFLKKRYKEWKTMRSVSEAAVKSKETKMVEKNVSRVGTPSLMPSRKATGMSSIRSCFTRRHSEDTPAISVAETKSENASLSDEELMQRILQIPEDHDNASVLRALSNHSHGQYIFQKLLGSGSFSKVKLAIDRCTGEKVAIKMISAPDVRTSPRLQQTLRREVEVLKRLDHPNIVKFREATFLGDSVCLVMDYVPGIELFQYVADKRRLGEDDCASILRQVLLALQYLHSQKIVHRDVKLENILVHCSPEGPLVTLVDFGLARITKETNSLLVTRCGSEEYAAPEVILGIPYDGRYADLWSFGVVMYACLVGALPFNPEHLRPRALSEKIVAVQYRPPEEVMGKGPASIVRSLLVREPLSRTSVQELLRHPWFQNKNIIGVPVENKRENLFCM